VLSVSRWSKARYFNGEAIRLWAVKARKRNLGVAVVHFAIAGVETPVVDRYLEGGLGRGDGLCICLNHLQAIPEPAHVFLIMQCTGG